MKQLYEVRVSSKNSKTTYDGYLTVKGKSGKEYKFYVGSSPYGDTFHVAVDQSMDIVKEFEFQSLNLLGEVLMPDEISGSDETQ